MVFLVKLSLTLLAFCGPSLVKGDCTVEVERATWHYTNGVDDKIPGVPTVEECKLHCLNNPANCRGYTHTTNGVEGFCYLFKELTGMRECSTCSSGSTPEYFEGTCPFHPEDELGEEITESAEACWQKCFDTDGCTSFTWYDSTTAFENICFLFSKCDEVKVCIGCQSGRVNCISTPQCFQYNIMDEETRNVHSQTEEGPFECYDLSGYFHQSPRWVGPEYYRMLPPAGKVIPETDPGIHYCVTDNGGYLAPGSHPDVIGQEVEAVVQFSEKSTTVDITITKCPGNYFVYKLPEAHPQGFLGRYCATLEN